MSGAADLKSILAMMGDSSSSAGYYLVYMAYAIHAATPQFKPSDMLEGAALERYPDVTTKGCWTTPTPAFSTFLPARC